MVVENSNQIPKGNMSNKTENRATNKQQAAHNNYVDDVINMREFNNVNQRKGGGTSMSRQQAHVVSSTQGRTGGSKTSLDRSYNIAPVDQQSYGRKGKSGNNGNKMRHSQAVSGTKLAGAHQGYLQQSHELMNFRAKDLPVSQNTQSHLFKNSTKHLGANAMAQQAIGSNYSRKSNSTGRGGLLRHGGNPAANIQNAVRRNNMAPVMSQGNQ